MKLVIMGPPGAGKGTQAEMLSKYYSIPHISTGDLFRDNITRETTLGKQVKQYLDNGELVSSKLTIEMLLDRLNQADTKNGFILDGFPRSADQAIYLKKFLNDSNDEKDINPAAGLDAVVELCITDDAVVERTLLRGRSDDKEETIRKRLNLYYHQTCQVIDYYGDEVLQVDALGNIEEVFDRIIKAISTHKINNISF